MAPIELEQIPRTSKIVPPSKAPLPASGSTRAHAFHRTLTSYDDAFEINGAAGNVSDHRIAMEKMIANGLENYALLCGWDREWRVAIFRGIEVFESEHEESLKSSIRNWLDMTRSALNAIDQFEAAVSPLEDSGKLRDAAANAGALLQTWASPKISMLPSLRSLAVSADLASEIQAYLDRSPEGTARTPAVPMREIPAEEFWKSAK